MANKQDILGFLKQRRGELRMPISALSERANTSTSTVRRVLDGDISVSYATLCRIAKAMGVSLEYHARSSGSVIREEAKRKAKISAKMVQGTSAMESQAVDKEAMDRIVQATEAKLIRQLGSALWAK
ncbi:MAG: helix-turn-helix domain-containing protein [Phycisphaerae bacterium]|nr:helix-turn-helix domain-containing protein [Phycisphaerae bacterium]